MSIDNKSPFLDNQADICEIVPPTEESPVICPTCIPNPNAIVPTWWETEEPFLNESNCIYSITVHLNDDGKAYDIAKMTNEGFKIKELIETYKRFGLLQLMRFYNKEISNETLFAFPSNPDKLERLNQNANRKIENSVQVLEQQLPNGVFSTYEIPGPILASFGVKEGDEFNPYAAELYVKANDYYISNFQTATGGEPILVQVTIPAFIFDRIPNAKPVDTADVQNQVILDGLNIKAQIERLKIAMGVFGKYQAYWWQTEKGRLVFQKTFSPDQDLTVEEAFGSPEGISDFYCKMFGPKLDAFIAKLEALIEGQTRFKFRRVRTPRSVHFIKISFNNSDPKRPYLIKKIEVKGHGCDYERVPLGPIKKLNVNNKEDQFVYPFNSQTVLGYVANIDTIDQELQAKTTPAWVDFCLQYTFPPLDIEYGKENQLTSDFGQPETILGCVVDNLGGAGAIRDFFLEQTVGFFDAIAYTWNQNNCKALSGTYVSKEEKLAKKGKQSQTDQRNAGAAANADQIAEIDKGLAETQKLKRIINEEIKVLDREISQLEISLDSIDDPSERASVQALIDQKNQQLDNTEFNLEGVKDEINTQSELKSDLNNPLGAEKEEQNERLREERLEQRESRKNDLGGSTKARTLRKDIRADAYGIFGDMSRKETRQLARDGADYNLEEQRQQSLDRRQQRGEKLGEDRLVADSRNAVLEQFPFDESLVGLFLSAEDFENFGLSGFDFKGGLQSIGSGFRNERGEFTLAGFIGKIGICGFNKMAQKAMQCLMSGIDLDTALRAIVKAALSNMAPSIMEKLLIGLDPRVQQDIKKQVERTFKNMPAPWETGYQPGSASETPGTQTRESLYTDNASSKQSQLDTAEELLVAVEALQNGLSNSDIVLDSPETVFELYGVDSQAAENQKILDAFKSSEIMYPNKSSIIMDWFRPLDSLEQQLNDEIERLTTALVQNELDVTNSNFREWMNLSDEEKEELIEREQEIANEFANGTPLTSKKGQGTIGKALGGIQEEIFSAYVDAIMDNVEIQELFSILDKFPGARLIARLITSFDCPNVHFIYPPIKSFLSTLTFDDCLDRGALTLPKIPKMFMIKTIRQALFKLLKAAFKEAKESLRMKVVAAVTLKLLLAVENALCKALEAAGDLAAEATLGSSANFGNVINELFCGSDSDPAEMNEVTSTLLASVGVTPEKLDDLAKTTTADDLRGERVAVMKSIADVVTGNQLKELFVANPGEMDLAVLRRISRTVTANHPGFALFFDDPSKVEAIFGALGNFMSPEQRKTIRDNLANPVINTPPSESICLTQEELKRVEDKKRIILTTAGLSPEEVEEEIVKDKERNGEAFFEICETLAKGPASLIASELERALLPDACGSSTGIAKLETPEIAKENEILAEGVFRSLQVSFSKDMIGKRDALLENILADTTDLPLKRHERRANSETFYIDYVNSTEDWEVKEKKFEQTAAGSFYFNLFSQGEPKGFFPDTVAIKLKEELEENTYDILYDFTVSQKPSTDTKSVRSGLLGRETDIVVPKPYLKNPDMILSYDNDKGDMYEFKIDLAFTTFKEGHVKIEKDFGYKVNIFNTTRQTEIDPETGEETNRVSAQERKQYGVFSPQEIDQSASVILEQYDVSSEELQQAGIPYQAFLLTNIINAQLASASHGPVSPSMLANEFYPNFTQKSFDVLSKGLLNTLDGDISNGFKFGYSADPLTPDDLLYVNPDSDPDDESTWEYTFDEEDGVLGRSATKNPRVNFLDPNLYGGKFRSPALYIEPTTYTGWLGLSQMLVPEIDGCKPKRTDFIDIKELTKQVRKLETSIPPDPRLGEDPDCVKRIPFDKISDPSTLAYLDGTVIATIRAYAAEALIKTTPLLTFLEYSDRNYDDGFAQMIVQEMEDGLIDETALFGGRIEGYNYWLLFLEQAVQSAVRKIDAGEIESTPEIEDARKEIDKAQRDHHYPQLKDLELIKELKEVDPLNNDLVPTATSAVVGGILVAAFPAFAATSTVIAAPLAFSAVFLRINEIRFASKIKTINSVKRSCKVLLKALVDDQLKFLSSKLANDNRFRPYVSDFSKYYLSLPNFMYGSTLKAGLTDIEKPELVGEINLEYGDVSEVSPEPATTQKLTELGLSEEQLEMLALSGGLFIEKYIRTIDKAPQGPGLVDETREEQQSSVSQNIINSRPSTLNGVCNITEFREWGSLAKEQIDPNLNISDLFGDASAIENSEEYEGSIGIKYGLRISLLPNNELKNQLFSGNWDTEVVNREKTYAFADTVAIPIVTYERDIKDIKFVDLDFSDPNLGEDLKCYVDKLVSTEQYRFIMDYVLGLKRIPTILAIYTNTAFVSSIGTSESERDEDAKLLGFNITSDEWKTEILKKTKKECRRLFAAFYRSDDFEQLDDNDASLREVISRFLPGMFGVNRLLAHWTTRRRLRPRPFDKNGNLCKNAFQRVFSPD